MNTQSSLAPDTGAQKLLSAFFNQDQGCFTISYETGFRVYNSDPMELNVKREWDPSHHRTSRSNAPSTPTKSFDSGSNETGGGIGLAQMLHRTNYLALVGGGRNPRFPQNKVIIWDDLKRRPALSLEFLSPVLNVLLSRTHIVVVLAAKVHVFAFSSPPARIASYETADNPHGVAVLASNVLAFPSRLDGQIQIVNLESHSNNSPSANTGNNTDSNRARSTSPEEDRSASRSPPLPEQASHTANNQQQYHYHTQNSNLVTIIRAHKGPIRCLALNRTGTIIASASDMGTIIRLHNTRNTALLHEFRRGLDRAIIYSMAFSPANSTISGGHHHQAPLRLAVLSDKNTLHVFDASALAGTATGAGIHPSASNSGTGVNSGSSSLSSSVVSTNANSPNGINGRNTPAGSVTGGGSSSIAGGIASGIGSFFSGMQLNRRHVLSKLPLMPRYFYSEWSFVSARVEGQAGVLGWPSDDCVITVWTDSCRWEKYVIVEKEQFSSDEQSNNGYHDQQPSGANGEPHGPSEKYELVREAWRGFEGLSYD